MKLITTYIINPIFFYCVFLLKSNAAEWQNNVTSVQSTNGLSFGILICNMKGTNTTEQNMEFIFRAPAHCESAFFVPLPEYLANMELFDESGKTVAKTALGLTYGKKFDEITWNIKQFASLPGAHPTMVIVDDRWGKKSWAKSLPKLSDLFKISKPGVYHLRAQVQIMLLYLNTARSQVREVVRFPPLDISVIQTQPSKE